MSDTTGHFRFDGAQPSDGRRRSRTRGRTAPRVGRRTSPWRHLRRAAGADRSPLCRPYDRARSIILLAFSALLAAAVAGAVTVALAVIHHEMAAAARLSAHRHLVPALTLSAPLTGSGYGPGNGSAEALARWTYAGTGPHSAWIEVAPGTPSGSTVPAWVDDTGRPAAQPRTTTAASADAALAGIGSLVGETGLLLLAAGLACHAVDRRAGRAWDDEWSRIEPGWSGRTGRPHGTS